VPNPDKKLMPGMTANLTIAVSESENVLIVPAAALRFRPSQEGGAASRDGKDTGGWSGRPRARKDGVDSTRQGGSEKGGGRGRVFRLVDGKPSPVRVKTGLSDGSRTEVKGEIEPGALVITGLEGASGGAAGAQGARPFGLQPQQSGRRRGI
jgi:HlyD family secretion protein